MFFSRVYKHMYGPVASVGTEHMNGWQVLVLNICMRWQVLALNICMVRLQVLALNIHAVCTVRWQVLLYCPVARVLYGTVARVLYGPVARVLYGPVARVLFGPVASVVITGYSILCSMQIEFNPVNQLENAISSTSGELKYQNCEASSSSICQGHSYLNAALYGSNNWIFEDVYSIILPFDTVISFIIVYITTQFCNLSVLRQEYFWGFTFIS